MKTLLILILTTWSCIAGTLNDTQGIFAGHEATISSAIAGEPVWIETATGMTKDGLRQYADSHVREITQRGFLVVINTNPKAWRISVNPPGMADSEMVRRAGDAMAARFRNSQFEEGAIGVARELTRLSQPQTTTRTVTTTTRTVQRPVIVHDYTALWVFFGLVFGGLFLWWCVVMIAEWAARRDRIAERRELREEERLLRASGGAGTAATPSVATAQAAFDRYTPSQREAYATRYVSHPSYYPGIWNDPLQFYMFMRLMDGPGFYGRGGYGYGFGGAGGYYDGGYAPATATETTTTTTTTESNSQPASGDSYFSTSSGSTSDSGGASSSWGGSPSYDSGSSGSYDSGGSSDSGSSSCDSGGSSGGDW